MTDTVVSNPPKSDSPGEVEDILEVLTHFADSPPVCELTQILETLPHRYPFLLVDRIVYLEPGQQAIGLKNVSFNEPHFQGHFPHRPIMPGVLILEAMAQVCSFSLGQTETFKDKLGMFAGIDGIKFRRQVVPGDRLIMGAKLLTVRAQKYAKFRCRSQVGDELVTEGDLTFFLVN